MLSICKLKANDVLFTNDTLLKIITYKWQKYGKKAFVKECLYFIIFIVIYLINSSYLLPLRIAESDAGITFWDGPYQQISFVTNFITDIMLIIYIRDEITQIRVFGFRTYFDSTWNYFDVPLVLTLTIVNSYSLINMFGILKNKTITKILHSICTFFFFGRLLSFSRGFEGSGFMVRLVIECVYDIRYFLMLMFFFIFGLTFSSN